MTSSVDQAIARFEPGLPLAIAYSGGADSTSLLLACAEKWPRQVRAIHVHHGLQAAAGDFERHCTSVCAQLGVPLAVSRIDARHAPGESPEEVARIARYEAIVLAARATWTDVAIKDVATGQHADDQVETLLLALSRGAGLPGLASMPARRLRDGLTWHRPLLDVGASEIRRWLRDRGTRWIDDPTNADERFTRNRIRARLLPVLEEAFPQFRATFARSAAHAAQAQVLLEQLALEDLERTGTPPNVEAVRVLSRERQGNVLRYWLKAHHRASPSAAQLEELLDQVAACSTRGHRIHIKVARGFVERREGGLVYEEAG